MEKGGIVIPPFESSPDCDYSLSSIDIPPCHHPVDYDHLCPIIDSVKNPVVPHASPVALFCG